MNDYNGYYIYFIRDGLAHIKIGITNNVKKRLDALQTANPMKLEYFFGMHVKTQRDALDIESELHEKFKDYRLMGEWFEETEVLKWLRQKTLRTERYTFNGATW